MALDESWLELNVRTGRDTPFQQIRWLQAIATSKAKAQNQLPNLIWGPAGPEEYMTISGKRIYTKSWPNLHRIIFEDLERRIERVTWNMELPTIPTDGVNDHIDSMKHGYSFLSQLQSNYPRLFNHSLQHILSTTDLRERFITSETTEDNLVWNRLEVTKWLNEVDKMVAVLSVLGFMTSGPGGRGTEWTTALLYNFQNYKRTVFFTPHGLAFLPGYAKVSPLARVALKRVSYDLLQPNHLSRTERYIPRFPHETLAALFLQYVVYIRPLQELFHLYINGPEVYKVVRNVLWTKGGKACTSEQLSHEIEHWTGQDEAFGPQGQCGLQVWRQAVTSIGVRWATDKLSQLCESTWWDDAMGHSRETVRQNYARDGDEKYHLDSHTLHQQKMVCNQAHVFQWKLKGIKAELCREGGVPQREDGPPDLEAALRDMSQKLGSMGKEVEQIRSENTSMFQEILRGLGIKARSNQASFKTCVIASLLTFLERNQRL